MTKINLFVKYCLINKKDEYNIKGILINNKIKFMDFKDQMIFDIKNLTLERHTKDSNILFDFKEKICILEDKDSNQKLYFNIKVLVLESINNQFHVKYKIDKDLFEILIKIVDIKNYF